MKCCAAVKFYYLINQVKFFINLKNNSNDQSYFIFNVNKSLFYKYLTSQVFFKDNFARNIIRNEENSVKKDYLRNVAMPWGVSSKFN